MTFTMPDDLIFRLGDVVLLLSTPAVVLFTILYGIRSRWRSTQPGRAVFYTALSFSLVLLLTLCTRWFGPDWPFRGWIRLVVYGFVTFSMWRQLITLVIYQRKYPNHKKRKESV